VYFVPFVFMLLCLHKINRPSRLHWFWLDLFVNQQSFAQRYRDRHYYYHYWRSSWFWTSWRDYSTESFIL